jgi:hypothetical protein
MEQQDLLDNHDTQERAMKLQDIHTFIKVEMSFTEAKHEDNTDRYHNPVRAIGGEILYGFIYEHYHVSCFS